MSLTKTIKGGVTSAAGFQAGAVNAGIKGDKPDMALLVSDSDAVIAGVFTTNRVSAAPVKLCRRCVAGGSGRAVVVNSGNANACTGMQGMKDAEAMAAGVAKALGIDAESVLVCSTGTIGVPMPMGRITPGLAAVAGALTPDGGGAAARAIMTTDTVPKETAVEITVDGKTVTVGGMAKGAGMIEPNMATMLAFLTTDAAVEAGALQDCLAAAVQDSFNRITVDGDMSTNDTVLIFANGAAGNTPLSPSHADWPAFEQAVREVTRDLALKIVRDGEGATKFVTVIVNGAQSDSDAAKATRAVANSLLVKTSWFGRDPNWGRIIDAVGYSGAEVDETQVDIRYDGLHAVKNGMVADGVSVKDLEAILAQNEFTVTVDLNLGDGTDTVYTCDCSYEYVKINAEYTT